jgi:DNA-binding beta-propeller fold protein YncE
MILSMMVASLFPSTTFGARDTTVHHYLYVATPGIRNYLDYGGHGLLVFDMDNNFKFIKRIPSGGLDKNGLPSNVKGICANAKKHRIYISTVESLTCIDLLTEKIVWEKSYEGGCDRMAISPDGNIIYLPTFEGNDWKVLSAESGSIISVISPHSGSHNTIFGQDGQKVYVEGLHSRYLTITAAKDHRVIDSVGPFSDFIRPFTINGRQSKCFVNINGLLGFEIGDLRSGKKTGHVEVTGFHTGPVKRHGCPSHGIALTPDETEIWLADGFNESIHIFDFRSGRPRQAVSIKLNDQPGWINFSIDGEFAFPSSGEVIDVKTRKIVSRLRDEKNNFVQSEKMIEIDFTGSVPGNAGDQFGIGRIH